MRAVIERMRDALNAHDIDAFVPCFDAAYRCEQPAHPDRAFGGYEQVRKNWSVMFSEIPDLHAELLGVAVEEKPPRQNGTGTAPAPTVLASRWQASRS